MPESQEDIDALLAEVSALADEAVADLGADSIADAPPAEPPPLQPADVNMPPEPTAGERPEANRLPSDHRKTNPARILKLEVPVIVRLAERTMPLSEILGLSSGAIIEFDQSFDSPLDLMINNKCVGYGQAVKVGENFGLRVGGLGTIRERIQAMGGQ